MTAPLFDDDLSFLQRVEDLTVQEFVPQTAVERLVVTILPDTTSQNTTTQTSTSGSVYPQTFQLGPIEVTSGWLARNGGSTSGILWLETDFASAIVYLVLYLLHSQTRYVPELLRLVNL